MSLSLLLRILGPLALLAGLWWGVDHVLDTREQRGFDRGTAEVQQKWDQETTQRAEDARLAAERALKLKEAERLAQQKDADEQARILADRTAALASARTERDRLRATIAALNAKPADSGGVPEARCTCGWANASAATARELLGECSDRREEVARDAGALAAQVIGLQAHARRAQAVCGAID